jgi:hypothetical protein
MIPTEKARRLVELAIRDHDAGGFAYAGLNEILALRISQALMEAEERGAAEMRERCDKITLEWSVRHEAMDSFSASNACLDVSLSIRALKVVEASDG